MQSQVNLKSASLKSSSLYDTDYQRWLNQTVEQLQGRDFDNLDLEQLIEEIESLGKRDKRALLSYLMRLCEHLLKLQYWTSEQQRCFRGWALEINNFRSEISLILQDSPSLVPFMHERFPSTYQKARSNLLKVLPNSVVIPGEPDFSVEQAMDEEWLPWQPDHDAGTL